MNSDIIRYPLGPDEKGIIRKWVAAAFPAHFDADLKIAALSDAVNSAIQKKSIPSEEEIILLGSIWGEEIIKITNWSWCKLGRKGSNETELCLLSDDNGLAIFPFKYILSRLYYQDPCLISLAYNTLKAGVFPQSVPGEFLDIMPSLHHAI